MNTQLIFGKYEIQHRIAIGGMGEVFYAMQRGVSGFERPVILKSLLPDLAQQQDLIDQFLDEARVAATLNHPNVVSIFEVGLWNGTFYIAMEYIRGRNLSQLIRKTLENQLRMPPQVTARIIRDAALGLDHAHHATDSSGQPLRIIHRDISPQNIMLREDGVTKVVDFGIASAANRSTRTATGMIKGKLAYMPPEQVRSEPMTAAVDQYALGVVFWEMLTTRRLFKADNDLALIKLVLEAAIPRPESIASDVPPAMADVAMRMLSTDPAQRYASLGECAEAIEGLLASQTPSLSPSSLMKRLGTDDLKVQVKKSTTGDNFVISLSQPGAPRAGEEVDLVSAIEVNADAGQPTGVLTTPAPSKRHPPPTAPRRTPLIAAGAAVLLALVAVGWVVTRPEPKPPTPVVVAAVVPVVVAPVEHDAGPPTPEVVPAREAKLIITTVPPGAEVRVDGRQLGKSPQELEVAPGTTHYVQAEHRGYERAETEVTLEPGQAQTLTLTLKAFKAVVTKPIEEKTPAAGTGPGFLTINTTPWTKVSVDGEPIGSTPISKRRLTAGVHKLVLINEGENINATRSVTIPVGENVKLQLALP